MWESETPIYSYTRAQAIEDGVLVDLAELSASLSMEMPFKLPLAMTSAAYEKFVAWTEEDAKLTGQYQDVSGRLWDVIWMAYNKVRTNATPDVADLFFTCFYLPRDRKVSEPVEGRLKINIGPGDRGEPVLTIMLPEED